MMRSLHKVLQRYDSCVAALGRATDGWFLGLMARLVFSSVLLMYFLRSAETKLGDGFFGFLMPSAGAYAQILPPIAESVSYDTSQIAFFPYGLIVLMGTWSEFILPVLILLGLFTRLASFGMIGFIAVMTYVDIEYHGLDAKSIGAFFDNAQDSAIFDQRLLWIFPLLYLAFKGAGSISLDRLVRPKVTAEGAANT